MSELKLFWFWDTYLEYRAGRVLLDPCQDFCVRAGTSDLPFVGFSNWKPLIHSAD